MSKELLLNQFARKVTVRVEGQFSLTATAPNPQVPVPVDLVSYFIRGAGFFYGNNRYIITAARNVLVPPQLLANNNRFPFVSSTQPLPNGTIPNTVTKVSRVIVSVNDAIGCNNTVNYVANVLDVDPAGNIALLEIEPKSTNCDKKLCVKDDVIVQLACSHECPISSTLYAYSHLTGFLEGDMANNQYASPDGLFQAEHILTNFDIPENYSGVPVLNNNGALVGMLTNNNNGPSSDFMDYVIKGFMYNSNKCYKKEHKCLKNDYKGKFTLITDLLGDFYSFRKGYLGVLWDCVDTDTYTTSTSPSTGDKSLIYDAAGSLVAQYSCPKDRGIQVKTLAGNEQVTYTILPGATPLAPFPALLDSILTDVNPQDIIQYFSGKKCKGNKKVQVGDDDCCEAPGVVTWRLVEGKLTNLYYRSYSEQFENLNSMKDLSFPQMPLALDYCWYDTPTFPVTGPGAAVAVTFSSPL